MKVEFPKYRINVRDVLPGCVFTVDSAPGALFFKADTRTVVRLDRALPEVWKGRDVEILEWPDCCIVHAKVVVEE